MLSCSYFGDQYTRSIEAALGTRLKHAAFIHREGLGAAYLRQDELKEFGEALAAKVVEDNNVGIEWCRLLVQRTDEITKLMNSLRWKEVGKDSWKKFESATYNYIVPHIAIKKVVDYLPAELLKEMLPAFEEARLYSEKVYATTEEFTREFADKMGKKTGLGRDLVLCLQKEELEQYFSGKPLPLKPELKARSENSALVFEDGKPVIYSGGEALKIESAILNPQVEGNVLKGATAFPGKASGIARVILNPGKPGVFNQGDILVTGMTRPEYLPLVKKCSAFVTDAGGMLSHAAITARELKKPCVVGTLNATKAIKSGMKVEVDAHKGTVKVLSK